MSDSSNLLPGLEGLAPSEGPSSPSAYTWAIYTLSDPRTGEVRYVGKSHVRPERRLWKHICDARNGADKTRCGNWKRKLLASGVKPSMRVIETGDGDGWIEAETKWIEHYRACLGERLTNMTTGGEGVKAGNLSEEHKAKIRAANMGRRHRADSRAKMSAARKGKHTEAMRSAAMRSAAMRKGTSLSEEHKARVSAGMKVAANRPEAKAKASASGRQRVLTALTSEDMAQIFAFCVGRSVVALRDVAKEALGINPCGPNSTSVEMALAKTLRELGFARKNRSKDGKTSWVYVRQEGAVLGHAAAAEGAR